MKQHLLTKIHDRTAVVAVVGLAPFGLAQDMLRHGSGQGYVGLPLAVAFAEQVFPVTFAAALRQAQEGPQCRLWH